MSALKKKAPNNFESLYYKRPKKLSIHEKSPQRIAIKAVVRQNIENWFLTSASKWKNETEGLSSISAKINHPAYKEIVNMGWDVLPFIFADLSKNTTLWFPALKDITNYDPVSVENRGNITEMQRAWLNWAKENGIVF